MPAFAGMTMFGKHVGAVREPPLLLIRQDDMKGTRPTTRTHSGDGAGYLFDHWPLVARRIRSARHLVLFLDFDGTLTPIRRRPEDVPPLAPPLGDYFAGWRDAVGSTSTSLADAGLRI
jgi:hypothetical protein